MGILSGVLNSQGNVGSRGAYHPATSTNPMVRNNPLVPPNTPPSAPPPETLIRPIQQFTDEAHAIEADVTPNIGSSVRTFVQAVQEDVIGYRHEHETVSAFIDQYVPIPWFHGDQSAVKNA